MSAVSIEPVLHSFAYALKFLHDQLAGLTAAEMVAQPGGVANHPAWVVGHLAHTCEQLAGALGVGPWLPEGWAARYGTGSAPAPDAGLYGTKDAALAALDDAAGRVARAAERLDDARLAEPFPDAAYRDVFPTIRHAITQVLVGHTAYHVGQVGAWRRAMGLPPIGRSFE